MKKRGFILIAVFLAVFSALYVYFFVYNKSHPSYERLPFDHEMQAVELFGAYRTDKSASDGMYTGKILQISGIPARIEKVDSLVIVVYEFEEGMFGPEGIRCTLLPGHGTEADQWQPGQKMLVKGLCTGYNETDVILEKCIVIQ